MTQTIIQIGNSLGITIPVDFVKKNNIKKGDKLFFTHFEDSIIISTKPDYTYQPVSDPEFLAALKEVEIRYGRALQKLVEK
jgi:antitoxin component of MazEF toxin-antitoxin module